jgi:hypothetical protein
MDDVVWKAESGGLRVRKDRYCYILEEVRLVMSGKNAGGVRWDSVGYYGTLPGLTKALIRRGVGFDLERVEAFERAVSEAAVRVAEGFSSSVSRSSLLRELEAAAGAALLAEYRKDPNRVALRDAAEALAERYLGLGEPS